MSIRRDVGLVVSRPLNGAANITRNVTSGVVRTSKMQFRSGYGDWRLWMNRTRYDYRTEVGDPRSNSAVYATVGWITRNFPEAPVMITREPSSEGAEREIIRPSGAGPGRMLQLLEKPNPWYSGVLQWMATVADVYCSGDGYWIKVRSDSGRVEQLWWAPSWMMEPKWDETRHDQFIGWYEYTVDGTTFLIEPRNVVHFRDGIDPRNTRKGLGRLKVLYREIFTDDEGSNMTASLMRNLGVPGVVISPANTTGPTGRFSDPEDLKQKFMEKFGGDKRGEPMITTVPTDVKILSWSPQQMDMRALRKIPEERITAVFGVAAIVAGLGAGLDRSTFSNFGEARKAAYQEAIIPGQRLMGAELEIQLLPDFTGQKDLDVWFDWKQATAMQENAADIWKRYQEAATKGLLTRASFKRAVGEPVKPEDDVYVMANNMLLLKPGEKPPEPKPATPALGPGEEKPKPKPLPAAALNGHEMEVIAG